MSAVLWLENLWEHIRMAFGSTKRVSPGSFVGVDFNAQVSTSDVISMLGTAGAQWVRRTLPVNILYNDPTGLAAWVAGIQAIQGAGFNVLILAAYEPAAWKTGSLASRYTVFATWVAGVLPSVPGCTLEWFNEWDTTTFDDIFMGGGVSYAVGGARFGDFLNIATPMVRPYTTKVITGGIGQGGATGGIVQGILSTALRFNFDAIATHAYGFPPESQAVACYSGVRGAGWSGDQWLTETGQDDSQFPNANTQVVTGSSFSAGHTTMNVASSSGYTIGGSVRCWGFSGGQASLNGNQKVISGVGTGTITVAVTTSGSGTGNIQTQWSLPSGSYDTLQNCSIMGGTFLSDVGVPGGPLVPATLRGIVPINPGYSHLFLYVLWNSPDETDVGFPVFRADFSQRTVVPGIISWNSLR